jgi:hypothetical protein
MKIELLVSDAERLLIKKLEKWGWKRPGNIILRGAKIDMNFRYGLQRPDVKSKS